MASFKDLKFLTIILYGILHILTCEATKNRNLKEADLKNCMEYSYYENDILFLNKSSQKIAHDENLYLNFYIMNEADGLQILLSKKSELDGNSKEKYYYVIVINTYGQSGISLGNKYLVKTYLIPYISLDFGPKKIEIVQKKNGTLLVYVPTYSAEPILQYDDASPIDINYFQLKSWSSSSKWFHSCPFDNLSDEIPASKNDICDCQNGFCATPGNCTVYPGFIPSHTNKTKCEPICSDGCPNGFCYSPGKCACNTGYFMDSTNICEPVCKKGCSNGKCIAPGQCECDDGYKWSEMNEKCASTSRKLLRMILIIIDELFNENSKENYRNDDARVINIV